MAGGGAAVVRERTGVRVYDPSTGAERIGALVVTVNDTVTVYN